jgi:hypothetical protein
LSCLLEEKEEFSLRDILCAVYAVVGDAFLVCFGKRREDTKIERLEEMS